MILKSEFEGVFFPDENRKTRSLMQLEETLNSIIMSSEVRRFVNAQKRKDTKTVEQMYIENLRKEKLKKKSLSKTSISKTKKLS